ncbi:MAG: YceI family protein [Flavobacteriales bacterium]|nr:YceI family protein [Flavobacteriales bacterium]
MRPAKHLPALTALLFIAHCCHGQGRMRAVSSTISFLSEAPLETITASNAQGTGLLDLVEHTFAVRIPVSEFVGFNSPLQREHFNENYMATAKWPSATFQGRIIEAVELDRPGTYSVRAKGALTIRGVARERILPCTIVVDASGLSVHSAFEVVLDDHGIRIPRLVQQKIAATVRVEMSMRFVADGR